jgi:hypothetical protein
MRKEKKAASRFVTFTYCYPYNKKITNLSKDTNIKTEYRPTKTIKEINILQSKGRF